MSTACAVVWELATPLLNPVANSQFSVASLFADPSSVPATLDVELGKYTRQGLRVLGLATRQLQVARESDVQVGPVGAMPAFPCWACFWLRWLAQGFAAVENRARLLSCGPQLKLTC